VEIKGLDEVIERIEGIADITRFKNAMGECCGYVEETAKENAPIGRTGHLAQFIKSEVQVTSEEIKGVIFNTKEYAPYVEYGTGLFAENGDGRKTGWAYEDEKTGEVIWTRGQRPQPFLRPALFAEKENILKQLRESVKK
jgi:HK97 gp10 family phage protein